MDSLVTSLADSELDVHDENNLKLEGEGLTTQAGGDNKLVQEEYRSLGRVKNSIYLAYLKSWGPGMIMPAVVLLGFLLSQLAKLSNDAWLAIWSQNMDSSGESSVFFYLVRT